jgi:hypothetical protein
MNLRKSRSNVSIKDKQQRDTFEGFQFQRSRSDLPFELFKSQLPLAFPSEKVDQESCVGVLGPLEHFTCITRHALPSRLLFVLQVFLHFGEPRLAEDLLQLKKNQSTIAVDQRYKRQAP